MNVFEEIEKALEKNSTVNVVIAGITCSGKTTLANNIKEYFKAKYKVTIIAEDDYFKNIWDLPRGPRGALMESLDAFYSEEFKQDVCNLLKNGVTFMPVYDIAANFRKCKNKIVRVGNINIFEGLHTISLFKELSNTITIFIDTDIAVCLKRRIERDTKKYNISEERIRKYWTECIIPLSDIHIFPQKELADISL